jgi:hypothetical protein
MTIIRGCGTRVLGGVYVETLLSADGHPIECMIKDPAIAIDPQAMGLTPVGIKLIEQNGVTHIFDWVGEGYYPYVSDFIEEVRRFGASRRLPSTLDFSRLSPESRLILVHSRAVTPAFEPDVLASVQSATPQMCPRMIRCLHDKLKYLQPDHICAAQWWQDHDAKARLLPFEMYDRELPSFAYKARQMPGPYATIKPGIFMVLPISRVAVVRDPQTGSHEATMTRIMNGLTGSIPLEAVDE